MSNKTLGQEIKSIFRNISISINMTVYALYLLYLIYAIYSDVGIKIVNIILAVSTGIFMIIYLILRLFVKKSGKKIKKAKHFYKNFKLAAKLVTTATAVYALVTATDSGSPFAKAVSFIGAAIVLVRVIVELVSFSIKRKIRKAKKNRLARREQLEDEILDYDVDDLEGSKTDKKQKKARHKRNKGDAGDDIIISVDECKISDFE